MRICNSSPGYGDDSARCSCCILHITEPAPFQTIRRLQMIEGITHPCEIVEICIDGEIYLRAVADCCGVFRVENPYPLAAGAHEIWARSCPGNCCAYSSFYIKKKKPPVPPVPVPVPTVETPECGSVIADPAPWIFGLGVAGNTVRVCIDGYGCQTAVVDQYGEYHMNFDVQFPDGTYTMTVTQLNPSGASSDPVSCAFTIDTSHFMVEPTDARMGSTFRTVDIDVLMAGSTGSATVYYLLLPPGSPAPSAEEIMNYQDATALLDGVAATGQFETPVNETPTTHTWALTGLDKPGAPAGTLGVVDGYRYDVYLYVVSAPYNSGVLTFDHDAVMGMPFASGLGTADNPFTIRDLTPEELRQYPDLLAKHPLNRPGVDENARQLENIERLITLYEETDGLYGLADSMALFYLMTSDIDLSGYAAAYSGAGWEPIGDTDGWINDRKQTEHIFSGVFDGGSNTISNLSITPTATDDYFVGYRGLFGAVEHGTIKNLNLTDVVIKAFTTAPGFAQLGSLISTAHNPTLTNLTLTNANITADCDTTSTSGTHQINIGGFVAAIFDGAAVNGITGQNISIAVPSKQALALGGFVGYTDKFTSYDSYQNISLSTMSISGYAMIGGFGGYLVYGANLIKNVNINQVAITAPGGQAGGLIGLNYIFDSGGNETVEDCTVQNVTISIDGAGDPGNHIGGLIGRITRNTFPAQTPEIPVIRIRALSGRPERRLPKDAAAPPVVTILRCSATGGQIKCAGSSGGLIGFFYVNETAENHLVTRCNANLPVDGESSNIGGLIGDCRQITISQCFAAGAVLTAGESSGGLVGRGLRSIMQDCYATGTVTSASIGGGVIAGFSEITILRCYRAGNVTADVVAGGIAGVLGIAKLQNSLVLSGAIQAPNVHRVLGADGGSNTLQNNYALDSVTPPGTPDPNGPDGGTITSEQIISSMQSLGWNTTTVWNTATVATLGRPTLLQNPE